MDARITKHRLANLISYDWLKMLVVIAAAVLLVILIFLMSATRVTNAQTFTIYAYTDLTAGADFNGFPDRLKEEGVFSYDILETRSEKFSDNSAYDLFDLRRTTGEGTVLFVSDVRVYATNEDGSPALNEDGSQKIEQESALYSVAMGSAIATDTPTSGTVYDSKFYLASCEAYLKEFFGENWKENAAPDEAAVRTSFLSRNQNDKRYRTQESREAGIEDERQRLLDLKEDYLFVTALFENGTFTHTEYEGENEDGTTFTSALGVNVGKLPRIGDLVYYTDDAEARHTERLNLVILYNNFKEAMGLRFEPVTFLRYLYEEYGA